MFFKGAYSGTDELGRWRDWIRDDLPLVEAVDGTSGFTRFYGSRCDRDHYPVMYSLTLDKGSKCLYVQVVAVIGALVVVGQL